jgi:hypothetical protein
MMLYTQQPSSSISNCTSTALRSVLTRSIRIGYFFCAGGLDGLGGGRVSNYGTSRTR